LDGTIITITDPIWLLYVQSEALWEAAEQHRAILKSLWPPTARGITQRSRAANEASNHQPRVVSYTTPWMNRQSIGGTQDGTMSRECQTGPHDAPTQDTNKHRIQHSIHPDSLTDYQSGLTDASSQDMSHLQIQPFISPDASKLCQQPESQASNLHASSGLRYGTHGSNSERDDDHQLPPSAKGLPSFQRSFGSDAWQRKEEPIDSTRWAKELKESERTYGGGSSPGYPMGLFEAPLQDVSDCRLPHSILPGPLQLCRPSSPPSLRAHDPADMSYDTHEPSSDRHYYRQEVSATQLPNFRDLFGEYAGQKNEQCNEATPGSLGNVQTPYPGLRWHSNTASGSEAR